MADEGKGPPDPSSAPSKRVSADELREQQAIAAALMIGEQSRRDDRQRMYWVVQRAGIFAAVISMIGLLILFAYSRIRQGYNPTFWMLAMAAVGAAGVVAAFWAYTESRRE